MREKQAKALYLFSCLHGGHVSVGLPLIVAVLKDLFHDFSPPTLPATTYRPNQRDSNLVLRITLGRYRRRPATTTGRIDTAAVQGCKASCNILRTIAAIRPRTGLKY